MFSPGFVSASKPLPSWPILSAGTSVTVALVLSLFLTFEHLCAYHQPEMFNYSSCSYPFYFLIQLITMHISGAKIHDWSDSDGSSICCSITKYFLYIPAVKAKFFSLLNSNVAFICELMRDCYEAFAMYCFERYLIACLGEYLNICCNSAQVKYL
ncbi:Protein LAZ1 homolog 1 [Zea mays]|uniref:Protein LAZ1 homolog 1 n=1 Tax=Zea mays TaxID=4577 RepID=A0A1D6PAN1_MAIZE|nr:Protein LAZ1 homolog 1 [Zea mays]